MEQLQAKIAELAERSSDLVGAHGEAFEELDALTDQFSPRLSLERGGVVLLREDRHGTSTAPVEPRVYDPSIVGIRHTFAEEPSSVVLSRRSGTYLLRLAEGRWDGLFVPIGFVSQNAHTRITTYYAKEARDLRTGDVEDAHLLLERYEQARNQRIAGPTAAPVI